MAKTKELLGLIVGFAAGTFLGALFSVSKSHETEKNDKNKKDEKQSNGSAVHLEE